MRSRRRASTMGGIGFTPQQTGAVTAWLRNTTLSGNISSVTDLINANPAVQSADGRRPAGASDGAMTFATNDVLSWPLIGEEEAPGVITNGTRQWGVAMWVDHDGGGTEEAYAAITNLTGAATALKVEFKRITTGFLRADMYVNGFGEGRRATATTNAIGTTPTFITFEFNADATGEENQCVFTVNTTVLGSLTMTNLGAGASLDLGLIAGVTGNYLIGNRRDSTAASPMLGRIARNVYHIGAAMSGVTQGLLTAAARTALMGLEPLV